MLCDHCVCLCVVFFIGCLVFSALLMYFVMWIWVCTYLSSLYVQSQFHITKYINKALNTKRPMKNATHKQTQWSQSIIDNGQNQLKYTYQLQQGDKTHHTKHTTTLRKFTLTLNHPSLQNKTTDVVIHQHSRKLPKMDILMSETCWAHNKWNKITSVIKLVFHSSSEGRLGFHAISTLVTVLKLITDEIFLVPWHRFERLEAGILSTRSELLPLCGVFYVCLQSDSAHLPCNWYVSLLPKCSGRRSQIDCIFRYCLKHYNNSVANKHDILQLIN